MLFKHAKLRNAPFEWVYDGLAPALLPQVLQRGKGMPLSLALVAAGVARRLGVKVQLLCAPEGMQSSIASGGACVGSAVGWSLPALVQVLLQCLGDLVGRWAGVHTLVSF